MKYLKLFEGFESNRISAILSFLHKKLNKSNADKFLGDLTRLAKKYDFPLSTLSDKEIEYLPVNKALLIGKGEEAMNPSEIYAIKYWFSIEKGYLCQTGVGNKEMKFGNYEQFLSSGESELTKDHLEYLARQYNLTGLIVPCDFDSLQSGDKVVMVCSDYFGGDNRDLVYGEIYYDDTYNHYYIFSNNGRAEGSTPDTGYMLPGYRYAWSLGRPGDENDDHCMIHKIIVDNKPLRFNNDDIKEEPSESVWDFNLPLKNNPPVELETWQSKYNETFKLAKEANFAIVLYLDDVLVKDISKDEISKERKDMRKDALALMSNEDIKKANVKRYLEKLFYTLGIQKDKQELKNLNSVVKSTILGEYFLMLNYDSSFISRLTDFIRALYKLMSKEDEEYYFSSLVDMFKKIKRKRLDQSTLYSRNIKYIKSLEVDNSDKVDEVLKRVLKIGKSVSDYFNDKEINTIEDLKSVQLQLRMILDLSQDDIFYLSGFMSNLLAVLDENTSNVEMRVRRSYSIEEYKEDVKKLEKLEKIINRDFLKK
jgi:hypothetical protein